MNTTKRPVSAPALSRAFAPFPARTTDRITPQRLRDLDARIDRAKKQADQTLAEIIALRRK